MRRLLVFAYLFLSTTLFTALILWPLIRDGMEINPDSVEYLGGSQNLIRGLGYAVGCPDDLKPITNFAPLYSVALAGLQRAGLPWLGAAQAVALFSYAALTALMFLAVWRFTGSRLAAALAQIATATNAVILYHTGRVISEPLSWVVVLLSLIVLAAELQQVRPARTILLAGLLSVAVLVRFANIGFLLGAAIAWALAAQRTPGKERLRGYVTFITIVALIFTAWLFRNWLAAGRTTEGMTIPTSLDKPWSVLLYTGLALVKVLLHADLTGLVQIVLAALLAIVLLWVGWRLLRLSKTLGGWQPRQALLLAAYGYLLGYALFIFGMRLIGSFKLETRMLSPTAFLFILMAASAAPIRWRLPGLTRSLPGLILLAGLTAIYFLSLPSYHATLRERSLGLYRWRDNQTLAYAAARLDTRTFLTPDAQIFLLWAGICPQEFTTDWAQPIHASTLKALAPAVVFLNRDVGSSLILPEDILWDVPAQRVAFPDGSIFFFNENVTP